MINIHADFVFSGRLARGYLSFAIAQPNNQIFVFLSQIKIARMSVFTKKLNLITGENEWVLHDNNYDFHQEIARSAFADMLHDKERVSLFVLFNYLTLS